MLNLYIDHMEQLIKITFYSIHQSNFKVLSMAFSFLYFQLRNMLCCKCFLIFTFKFLVIFLFIFFVFIYYI